MNGQRLHLTACLEHKLCYDLCANTELQRTPWQRHALQSQDTISLNASSEEIIVFGLLGVVSEHHMVCFCLCIILM